MLKLLTTKTLPDFPSGSSINFYKDFLFLIGDDATGILIMDQHYNRLNNIPVFNSPAPRINKSEKADFESASIISMDGHDNLLILGSGSRKNRMMGIIILLEENNLKSEKPLFQIFDFTVFSKRTEQTNIGEINLEGSAVIGTNIILGNRANGKNPDNAFIITAVDFWKRQADASIFVSSFSLPQNLKSHVGVSEMCYVPSKDLLLVTLTTELTANAYDDGAIGSSYIGWIKTAAQKINQPFLVLDKILKLEEFDRAFIGEKIEGITVERVDGDSMILHLVSDNDLGESKLFKVNLSLG